MKGIIEISLLYLRNVKQDTSCLVTLYETRPFYLVHVCPFRGGTATAGRQGERAAYPATSRRKSNAIYNARFMIGPTAPITQASPRRFLKSGIRETRDFFAPGNEERDECCLRGGKEFESSLRPQPPRVLLMDPSTFSRCKFIDGIR